MDNIADIRARCEAATPGPWRWHVNEHAKSIRLVTDHSGQYYVMGFERYGMHGAQPTFQTYQKYSGPVSERGSRGMVKASEMSKWNQDYRHDDGWVEHPDAQFIAHAAEDIPYLLGEVERLLTESEGLVKLRVSHIQNRITDPHAKYDLHSIHSECYAGFDGTCTMPHCSGCPIRKMYIVMQDIENQAEAVLATHCVQISGTDTGE